MKCLDIRVSLLLLLLPVIATNGDIVHAHNDSAESSVVMVPVGEAYKSPVLNFLYPPGLTVQEIVQLESTTLHWHPWKHVRVVFNDEGVAEEGECEVTNSLDDLPEDIFTRKEYFTQRP